jgi:hypothetical protein
MSHALSLGWGWRVQLTCFPSVSLWTVASLCFLPYLAPHSLALAPMSCNPSRPSEGNRLLLERRPMRQVLPTASRGGRLCLATHLGPLMPAGHCQPLWQRPRYFLAPKDRIFHFAIQPGAMLRVVGSGRPGGTCLSKAASAICPHFPHLGQGRKAERACPWGKWEGTLFSSSVLHSAHPSWSQSCPLVF